jgi:hypothetical protein
VWFHLRASSGRLLARFLTQSVPDTPPPPIHTAPSHTPRQHACQAFRGQLFGMVATQTVAPALTKLGTKLNFRPKFALEEWHWNSRCFLGLVEARPYV